MAAAPNATEATPSELLLIARLTLGARGEPVAVIEWDRVLRRAAEERCAPLAWLRSAPAIRRLAPPEVVSRWRACAVMAEATTEKRLRQLDVLIRTLGDAGVSPVVMKGLPLALMLYGNASARPVSDTDLYIPPDQREAAHMALVRGGWVRLYGGREREETYRHVEGGEPHFLELHSALLDDNMLQHLSGPVPEARLVAADGASFMAHWGASLAVFLAVHLAKHPRVPLLWWFDFATMWQGLDASQRSEAMALAAEHRLGRFIDWAVDGAAEVAAIASASDDEEGARALAALRARHSAHPVTRISGLASSAGDRVRVCLAWAFPRAERSHPLMLGRRTFERGLGWTQRQLRTGLRIHHGA
jgi:hypothetical protein